MTWFDSPPPYTDYPEGKNAAGEAVLITNKGKNAYWERQVTTYSDKVKPDYGPATKSTMLDVDFINALGITAKKITVLQDNNKAESSENQIIFEADGTSNTGTVKIGGFEVDSNSLSTGSGIDRVIIKSNATSTITPEDIPTTAGGDVGVYRPTDGKTYILLDFIESTGKEYIDLGIYAKNIANATLDFRYTGEVSDSKNVYDALYGTDSGLQIAREENGNFTAGATPSNIKLTLNTRYVCEATYAYTNNQEGKVGTGTLKL